MQTSICLVLLLTVLDLCPCQHNIIRRALQKSHEKTPLEKWRDTFYVQDTRFDQTLSLVNLIKRLTLDQLRDCTPVILYDVFTEDTNDLLLEKLFRIFPIPYLHGQITEQFKIKVPELLFDKKTCVTYILFLKDVMRSRIIIGPQANNRVVVIARSSQWRVYEFLSSEESHKFMNLIVIAKSEKIQSATMELPYILYTHKLFIDALGTSTHQVLTSWRNNSFTQSSINMFPRKMIKGFAGHRFIVSLANQPPYVIKKGKDENDDIQWDGIEVRLVEMLSKLYNFTTDYREAKDADITGSSEAVSDVLRDAKADMGIAGLYVTDKRIQSTDTGYIHSQDCANFITLTSTALPRYRAIMGPFRWTVWLSLTLVYMFAILPLAFSDKHTLKHLIKKPEEIENMFWYVFGTFTNCFTFVSKKSWSKSEKLATRLLIGFYWLFTIIITACYTGSIIAFVTLPTFPETVDTAEQLISGRYQIGTLDKGGWQYWFENATDDMTLRLLKNVDLVPDVESGLKNTTKAFFWPYAFLASRDQLDYIVRTNFTITSKRSLLHISSDCFAHYGVSLIFNKNSLYSSVLDHGVLKVVQSGIMGKLKSDVEWDMMRSATGKLLAANSFGKSIRALSVEDRALTLDDTQGMFLLLALGFILGGSSLLSEWLGGCFNLCRKQRSNSAASIETNYRPHDTPTPREKLDSLQCNSLDGYRIPTITREESNENDDSEREENCVIVHNHCSPKNEISAVVEEIDNLFNFEDSLFGDENKIEDKKEEELAER